MTPYRSALPYAFGVIVAGLAGRSAIDKLLAAQGGGEAVALWAQMQSVVEMVAGVVGIGIGQGVTVLVAQQLDGTRRRALLRAAWRLGAIVGGAVGLVVLAAVLLGGEVRRTWFPAGPGTASLAVATGWLGIASAVVCAAWMGRQRQDRVFWLVVATTLVPVGAALAGAAPGGLLAAQAAAGALVTVAVAFVLAGAYRGDATGSGRPFAAGGIGRPLLAYVPVGVVINLASPLALVAVRGVVSSEMSWHDAGRLQAIWRAADWVTALMSGVLALVVLPRLSVAAAEGRAAFARILSRAALFTLVPTTVLLAALWATQRDVLAALYDDRFAVDPAVVGVFFLGDLLRVASWVILFALLARRMTIWVTVGEFLSMPLFAVLVLACSEGMNLQRAAALYLLTYATYLAFNLFALRTMMKGFR